MIFPTVIGVQPRIIGHAESQPGTYDPELTAEVVAERTRARTYGLVVRLSSDIEKKRCACAFDIRYADTVDPRGEPWEKCSQVLSRRDVVERLSRAGSGGRSRRNQSNQAKGSASVDGVSEHGEMLLSIAHLASELQSPSLQLAKDIQCSA